MIDAIASAPSSPSPRTPDREALRDAATAFEAAFLAEMLGHAGVGGTPDSFGGGAGEDAFSSLLTQEHARLLAEKGGLGLADAIEASLAQRYGLPGEG
ncbi:MAG: rod-binding protein [Pseudomonadota bacterium]